MKTKRFLSYNASDVGIREVEGTLLPDYRFEWMHDDLHMLTLSPGQHHETYEQAQYRAEQDADNEVASLLARIDILQRLKFDPVSNAERISKG